MGRLDGKGCCDEEQEDASHGTRSSLKYARLERERRFLLAAEPPGADEVRTIEDRYLHGTRLRLRRVVGRGTVLKLGQQDDVGSGVKRVTTIYLSETEFAFLDTLPADAVTKTRATVVDGVSWAVDTYPDGTRVAETEEEVTALPAWVGEEITGRPEWTGAALSRQKRVCTTEGPSASAREEGD